LGTVEKFFGQDGSAPLEKIGPYAYELMIQSLTSVTSQ